MNVSENIQMYLVELAILNEDSKDSLINLSKLAEVLKVQTVSVNQMIHKLDELGLVSYQPYKGVSLTEIGHQQAMDIIRHRRLWEVFFVSNLGFEPASAEEIACQIEHITTEEIDDRLSAFLDHPKISPLGKTIPSRETNFKLDGSIPLSNLSVGEEATVLSLSEDKDSTSFFHDANLFAGSIVKILSISENSNVLIEVDNKKIHLAHDLCAEIKTRRL